MSFNNKDLGLTGIQNPIVGDILEEAIAGTSVRDLTTQMLDEKTFSGIKNKGARFNQDRALKLSSQGTVLGSESLAFDRDSYFLEINRNGNNTRFFTIEADQGIIVASEGAGAGFIASEGSFEWGLGDEVFADIEVFLRDMFDLSDRTHLFDHQRVYKVPSYSDILKPDGSLPSSEQEFLVSGNFGSAYETSLSGLWLGDEYGFKGRKRDSNIVIDNLEELKHKPDLTRLEPQNNFLDISDVDQYEDVDLDLFADQVLELASEVGIGLEQNKTSGQNVLGFKTNSDNPTLQLLGAGEYDLKMTEEVREVIEDRLKSGNNTSDLMERLGRMVETPYRDDRFNDHEVGYWEGGGDLRVYSYTPEGSEETYILKAGTHQEVEHLYQYNNPSDVLDHLMEEDVPEEMWKDIIRSERGLPEDTEISISGDTMITNREGEVKGASHFPFDYLDEVLSDVGYDEESIGAVKEFLASNFSDAEVRPATSEFYKMLDNKGYEQDIEDISYDRIDLIVEESVEETRGLSGNEIVESIDSDSEFNEIHLREGLSLNLKFEENYSGQTISLS